MHTFVAAGSLCGSELDDDCTNRDACNAFGVCEPNHEAAATACGSEVDDACTNPDECDGAGTCVPNHESAGAACGSPLDDACTHPDACDGGGACSANDVGNGSECEGGSCTAGVCVEDQPVGCPVELVTAVPFETNWRTVGGVNLFRGACDLNGTPDYAVVFTAPADGTFRFDAAGLVGTDDPESGAGNTEELADSVLTIADGNCQGPDANQRGCNDDNDGSLDSRLDLILNEGETVTVYVGEFGEVLPGGGSGTLSITQLDN